MLIESDRHRAEDSVVWRVFAEADCEHSRTAQFLRHAADAKRQIIGFHKRPKPYYVGCSWGKDSVVLLHLFLGLGYSPRVVYVRQLDNENPESLRVRDAFLSRFDVPDYEEIAYSYADAEPDWFAPDGRPIKWYRVLNDLRLRYGVHVTGVRADESSTRMLRYQRFGCETRASFAPFRFFRVADIFAYMSMFDLPIHPNYAMVGGGRWDRNRIRVTSIGNREGTGHGRAEWEREYYGDVLGLALYIALD